MPGVALSGLDATKQSMHFRFNFQTARDDSGGEPSLRAKRSNPSRRKERMDCFAALAMTAKRTFAPSPRHAPEALIYLSPKEGVGNAGCPLHPRPRVHLVVVERTRVTTSTPESPGVPARNGFTAYFELSPATGSFATVTCGLDVASAPGRADTTSATLTPAPRRQDHTTSPYAATSFVSSPFDRSRAFRQPALQPCCAPNAAASTASHPAFVTTRDRPSCRNGMARVLNLIWPDGNKYFSENQK